jgi:hypothetical protein
MDAGGMRVARRIGKVLCCCAAGAAWHREEAGHRLGVANDPRIRKREGCRLNAVALKWQEEANSRSIRAGYRLEAEQFLSFRDNDPVAPASANKTTDRKRPPAAFAPSIERY